MSGQQQGGGGGIILHNASIVKRITKFDWSLVIQAANAGAVPQTVVDMMKEIHDTTPDD